MAFVSLNAETEFELSRDFELDGYPNIKVYLPHSSAPMTYSGEVRLRPVLQYLGVASGITVRGSKVSATVLLEVNDANFDSLVMDPMSHILLLFYQSGELESDRFELAYEAVADAFKMHPNVKVGVTLPLGVVLSGCFLIGCVCVLGGTISLLYAHTI